METKKSWKYYLGMVLLFGSAIPYIVLFAVLPYLQVSTAESLSIASALVVSSEVMFLASLAFLGKEFINSVKEKVMSIFSFSKTSKPISRVRFSIGMTLFVISIFTPTVLVESIILFGFTDYFSDKDILYTLIAFDVIFISSIFILGEDFLHKLKNLFTFPTQSSNL
ncbi:MAG: transporter suffix domain-containing protein [Helicobacteraceae bacterium]|nr:transporter suffix domain-containing protein [Helicobacteraceae bacterium]